MDAEIRCIDGNEAAAHVAYRASEVVAIYPITPSSPMGELADAWSARDVPNVWGTVPRVIEMQSEGGAAGAVHGAIQGGALTTTFTASQGLLLMIPNMYKIAGELSSVVFHIAARSVAAQALSIFGDHSDVMAARSTGFGMLFSNSPQEAHDLALVAHAATLAARVPFMHVFDGFRTSHEIRDVCIVPDDVIRTIVDGARVRDHRARALNPDRPFVRGTAQNPDTFFQARESANPFYAAAPEIVENVMDAFARATGRRYRPFEYVGAPDAERVIVAMGSACDAIEETVEHLVAAGERVGAVKVRLYRPFDALRLLAALPPTVRAVAVLDRTKEPGAAGEPLYQDVMTAVAEDAQSPAPSLAEAPRVVGGRYGLSSKEFTPAMVRAVFDNLAAPAPRNHFTVGIHDDVTHTSLPVDDDFDIEPDDVTRATFWGLGSDGTVGANKNSIRIIGEATGAHVQGYFVYDSRKAGAQTVSHLRFGPRPIRSTYLIRRANFVAVHQWGFLERYDPLAVAVDGARVLINSPVPAARLWARLPERVRRRVRERNLELWCIDAYRIAREHGLGVRINTIMQTAFFCVADLMPVDEAIERIRESIRRTYGKRGRTVVDANLAAVEDARGAVERVPVPPAGAAASGAGSRAADTASMTRRVAASLPPDAPAFVRRVTAAMIAGEGDALPVSAFPPDGTYPSATTRYEKRRIALEAPRWEPDLCIQCGKCVMVCPHAVIRSALVEPDEAQAAPAGTAFVEARWRGLREKRYTIQVSVDDCTGCRLCVEICPAKDRSNVSRKALNMVPLAEFDDAVRERWAWFEKLPDASRRYADAGLSLGKVKDVQLARPLFEFSGACAGCGETPYLRLMTQLFGDHALVANATGCSSIYGGNMPTTPWAVDEHGRGPAWSNSLFEDNAEFGLGMRLAIDKQAEYARELVTRLRDAIGDDLADAILGADQSTREGVEAQRGRVARLRRRLEALDTVEARELESVADALVRRSVWIVGGDGWAYDIGFGGLDHVLASGRDVNLLVLDTEVYSNTGGQASKATPIAAVAKFAAAGKSVPKKDLGRIAMSYGHVYVAQVALGADDAQTLRAMREAEAHPGPSLILAYSHCIAHGIDMARGMHQQRLAVESGYWPLYRYDPAREARGETPLVIDSKPPRIPLSEYMDNETRYRVLAQVAPDRARELLARAQAHVNAHWKQLVDLAGLPSHALDDDVAGVAAAMREEDD